MVKQSGFVIARTKEKNALISQVWKDKKDAQQALPFYLKKGWTGGIRKIKYEFYEYTKEEKQNLQDAQVFLNKLVGKFQNEF